MNRFKTNQKGTTQMKKLNIGGAAVNVAPATTKNHATVETGERLTALIRQFIVVNPNYKKYKAQHETLSRDIGQETRMLYFDRFAGVTPQSSTMIAFVDHKEVQLIVKDQYSQSLTDDQALVAAIGQKLVDKYFHWRTKYTVDFDLVPEAKQEAFAADIETARVKHGLDDKAVIAKQFVEPKVGFHDARTVLLTPEQNRKLDAILPVRSNPVLR